MTRISLLLSSILIFSITSLIVIWPTNTVHSFNNDIKVIQSQLTSLGYSLGPVDGILGNKTRTIIKQFQKDNGLIETGELDLQTNETIAAQIAKLDVIGRGVTDLIIEQSIEIEIFGNGISEIDLRLKNIMKHDLKVIIPAGTFFTSNNSSTQNMVSTKELSLSLGIDQKRSISVPVACADLGLAIPQGNDTFSLSKPNDNIELRKLIPRLSSANFPVRQAAVWILTDNADYKDLGRLKEKGYPDLDLKERIINETEAYEALKLLQQIEIDIRQKRIWRDIKRIREVALWKPLYKACWDGNITEIRRLLNEGANVNLTNNYGLMPLMAAVNNDETAIVEFLIDHGASLKGDHGSWPLYGAVRDRKIDIVSLLISKGADVNGKNWDCDTPLWEAVNQGDRPLVELLIKYGANVNLRNDICYLGEPAKRQVNAGKSPLQEAQDQNDTELVEFLRLHGAKK